MKTKIFYLIVLLMTVLMAGALPSCRTLPKAKDMRWSFGVEGMRPENIKQLGASIEKDPPRTSKELEARIGCRAMGTYRSPQGFLYSYWEWAQNNIGDVAYLAYCVAESKAGKIQRCGIKFCVTSPSWESSYGDRVVIDEDYPPYKHVCKKVFRARSISWAQFLGRRIYFSPSGLTSCNLDDNWEMLGWDGEKSITRDKRTGLIYRGMAAVQPSSSGGGSANIGGIVGGILAEGISNSLTGSIATSDTTSTTSAVDPAVNRANTQARLAQIRKERDARIKENNDYKHDIELRRARRGGRHWLGDDDWDHLRDDYKWNTDYYWRKH